VHLRVVPTETVSAAVGAERADRAELLANATEASFRFAAMPWNARMMPSTVPKRAMKGAGSWRQRAGVVIDDDEISISDDARGPPLVVSDASDPSARPLSSCQSRLVNVKGFNKRSRFTFNDSGPYAPNIDAWWTTATEIVSAHVVARGRHCRRACGAEGRRASWAGASERSP
jgi:hypothetical protein